MKKFNFLICYDISNPKRLSRVAKTLEAEAMRIQKSIFLAIDITKTTLLAITKILEEIIDKDNDDIRIYQIDVNNSINLRSGINLKSPFIINDGLK